MADVVTGPTILQQNDARVTIKIVNQSDGTGEASVKKVDVSALAANSAGAACAHATINQLWYDIGGMRVALEWNATSNVVAAVLGGSAAAGNVSGYMDFRSFGGIKNTLASGYDGDIDLTTSGHTNLDHYTIVLELSKNY